MEGGMHLFFFFPHRLIPKLRAAPSAQASLAATHVPQARLVETLTGGRLFAQGKLGVAAGFYKSRLKNTDWGSVLGSQAPSAAISWAQQAAIRPRRNPPTGLVRTNPTVRSPPGRDPTPKGNRGKPDPPRIPLPVVGLQPNVTTCPQAMGTEWCSARGGTAGRADVKCHGWRR